MPDPVPPAPPADGGNPPANPANPPAPPAADVNAAVAAAIAQREAEHAKNFKEATGFDSLQAFTEHKLKSEGKLQELADSKANEAAQFKSKYQQTAIQNALMLASSDALKPEQIVKMLSSDCVVDDNGNVTINGKSVKEAVADYLKENPNLAKPSGNQGSGSSHNAGNGQQKTMLRSEFDKLPAAAQMQFMKANGQVTE